MKLKTTDTLMPIGYTSLFHKVGCVIVNFQCGIGVFKTIGFAGCILLSLSVLDIISSMNYNLIVAKTITAMEYTNSVIPCCTMLLIISLYELWYLDRIISLCVGSGR